MTVAAELSERVRRIVIPWLGKVVQRLDRYHGEDLYVQTPAYSPEFTGRVDMGEDELEEFLMTELGFEVNPAAARKHRVNNGEKEYEEGSFRLLNDPYGRLGPREQLHVRVFDGDVAPDAKTGYVLLYAHVEYRWDTDPIKHYRGVDVDYDRGIEMVHDLLDDHDIDYTTTE